MGIDSLKTYLEDPDFIRKIPFSESEITEPLLTVYIAIKAAINQDCSIIEVSNSDVQWKQQEESHHIGKISLPRIMKHYFELVISNDLMIESHIQVISDTNDRIIYKLH